MHYILFLYLSTVSAQGGVSVTNAEFNNEASCLSAAIKLRKQFSTFWTKTPKVACLPKEIK